MLLACPQCGKANILEGASAAVRCYFCQREVVRPLFLQQVQVRNCAGCGKRIEGMPTYLMSRGLWQAHHHGCATKILDAEHLVRVQKKVAGA